ncbi:MAG: hypothetical protein ABWK04_02785 [Hydrogenobacter sp.]|uniref:hypothetical protein n=1 Tax=Hydrogenobacter thermophilus TaxID=940 RepID=UPI0030F6C331
MDQDIPKEKLSAYIEKLNLLRGDLQKLMTHIESTVPYAPVEGCEIFMKKLYDAINEHLEAINEAVEHWEWIANKEG